MEAKRTSSQIGKSNVARSKSHERSVAHWLSDWSGKEFRRRRVEGRDTSTRVLELTADVICLGSNFKFSVEAKCGAGFSFDSLFTDVKKALFTTWWHQACYDASLCTQDQGRLVMPMVFFRPGTNQNWVAFSNKADFQPADWKSKLPHLTFDRYDHIGPVTGDISHTKKPKLYDLQLDGVVFARWKDFCEVIDPASAFEV